MTGLAAASGGSNATGNALRSSGPSASYGGKIVAAVKPNIVFTEELSGNPVSLVRVRTSPDGTILNSDLVKSSGNNNWDQAVLNAIYKTGKLPRDENGRVPPSLDLYFRPKD